ncbi:MAG: EI24 domain-containing protein [Luteibaculaceae bacterium]
MAQFLQGIAAFIRAPKLVFQYNLWWFLVIPILLSLLISATVSAFSTALVLWLDAWMDQLFFDLLNPERELLSYFKRMAGWILKYTIHISLIILVLMYGKYVVLILLSPVLSLLSMYFARKHFGVQEVFSWTDFLKQVLRSVVVILRNVLFKTLMLALCFLLVYFFPPLLVVQPFVIIGIACYFYGYTLIDFVMERKSISPSKTDAFVFKNAGLALGLGLSFSVLFKIPFLGLIFSPIFGVIAATLLTEKWQSNTKQNC